MNYDYWSNGGEWNDDYPDKFKSSWDHWKPTPTDIHEISTEIAEVIRRTKCYYICFDNSGDIVGACQTLDDALDIQLVAVVVNPIRDLAWARVVQDMDVLEDIQQGLVDAEGISNKFAFSMPAPMKVGVNLIANLRKIDF
jgi:hypothetical protein